MAELMWLKDVLVSFFTTAAIVIFGRKGISEWLTRSVQYSFDRKLEALKAGNERELAVLASALDTQKHLVSSAFLQAQSATTEKRLAAIQTIWDAMLQVYFATPGIVAMTDILTDDDSYQMFFENTAEKIPNILNAIKNLSNPEITLTVEKARLLAGEYLYALYKAYSAILGRITYKLAEGRERKKFQSWWTDESTLDLLRSVLTTQEFNEFCAMRIGRYQWITRTLEVKFLETATEIIDGHRAASDAAAQATKIVELAKGIAQPQP